MIESIEQDGKVIYRHPATAAARIGSADGVAFYQLKTMLQGVLQRGTATRIAGLAPYVAGKTGTTDGENDVWFVGFTNEVTVAVWVGYDNADGRRRTLGGGVTGGSVAVPIFEPIIQAVWQHHAPRTALRGPTPETRKFLVAQRSEQEGEAGERTSLIEYLRRDARGQVVDTRYRLVGEYETSASYDPYAGRDSGPFGFFRGFTPWGGPPNPRAGGPGGPGGYGGFNPPAPPRQYERPLWRGDQN